jgi:MFS family permease
MSSVNPTAKLALRFVLTVGIVNLFADMTYEGARSVNGPFLGSLGATATVVGVAAGFGEFVGYGLRSISGYVADKTHQYWTVVVLGYAINMLAVPALALAGNWPVAAGLIIAERTGRAIRRPAVEAMISHAGRLIGRGWVFGLNEALDQTGATIGPLIAAFALFMHGGYRRAYAMLLIPAGLCLATIVAARVLYPRPEELEKTIAQTLHTRGFSKAYWTYVTAGALIAAGFVDFALIGFHFQKAATVPQAAIPIFYAIAMAAGALAALVFGRLLDKLGLPIVLAAFFGSALFAPLVFFGGFALALVGMVLWGIGVGAQDSLLKAVLTDVVPADRRSTAFGVFDTAFGMAWFLGSAAMGWLYDKSVIGLVAFSVALQLAALPVLVLGERTPKHGSPG